MGLKNMSLLTGATLAATGGTALDFVNDGVNITNGLHLIVPTDVEYQTRRNVTAKFRPPTLDPKTGESGKDKKSLVLVEPIVLPSGRIVFNTIRIEREMHPSVGNEDCEKLNKIASQLLFDADTANFWAWGSLD